MLRFPAKQSFTDLTLVCEDADDGSPLANATVTSRFFNETTDMDGQKIFDDQYKANDCFAWDCSSEGYAPSLNNFLYIEGGDDSVTSTARLKQYTDIAFNCVDESDGSPLAGATVTVRDPRSNLLNLTTQAGGNATVDDVWLEGNSVLWSCEVAADYQKVENQAFIVAPPPFESVTAQLKVGTLGSRVVQTNLKFQPILLSQKYSPSLT